MLAIFMMHKKSFQRFLKGPKCCKLCTTSSSIRPLRSLVVLSTGTNLRLISFVVIDAYRAKMLNIENVDDVIQPNYHPHLQAFSSMNKTAIQIV